MARMLANENVPGDVVVALQGDGHDVTWMRDVGPGSPDDLVLALALSEGRVVLTFDKDFGELAFRLGQKATPGVILLRPRLRSPEYLTRFTRAVLAQGYDWEGHFAVAEEGRLRIVPFPWRAGKARLLPPTSDWTETSMDLTAVFLRVPEGYVAFIEELPGANTRAPTLEEAREDLKEAVAMVLEANRELARGFPGDRA